MSDLQNQDSDLSPRSQMKREAITRGALELFLENGFLGSSVDDIALRAGVSKQTVYKHFGDKENLFSQVVIETISRFGQPFFDEVEDTGTAADLEETLKRLAFTLINTVMEPNVIRLRRLIVAEVSRFPDLGKHYVTEGPGRGIDSLKALFDRLVEQGLLHTPNTKKAAEQFTWLVVSAPINQVMLQGDAARPSKPEMEEIVDNAVAIFIAAFTH